MTPSSNTYDSWHWWCASDGGRSAAEEKFFDLPGDVRIAIATIMRKWLRGECTRREHAPIDGLHELRYRNGNNHYRILFTTEGRRCVALHAFYKNQQQTEKKDLDVAKKRARSGSDRPYTGHSPR